MRSRRARPALAVLLPGFEGTTVPAWLDARLRDGLAGVCLFATNVESPDQLRSLCADIRRANPHAVIAIDEEGGDVTRLYQSVGSPYPGNAILGRIDDVEYTESVGRAVGRELAAIGINLDLAPDVDINSNENNPVIGVRSFGSDPRLVARHAAAWVRGLQSTGVAASIKHYPGHGDTSQDSHLALPVVDLPLSSLRERELVPFEAAIAAGAKTVMTSHIVLPQLDSVPATFSHSILGMLRENFDGVIVSDALDMVGASGEIGIPAAAVKALDAGCDLLCIGTANTDEQLSAISAAIDAVVDSARLSDAIARVALLGVAPQGDARTEPTFDLARTAATFDIGRVTVRPDREYYRFETVPNIAVGNAPWGPAGATILREGEPYEVASARQPVLIGRDNHRHGWVRRIADDVRARHPNTIVIDLGWPAADRRYADIATFGSSRHAFQALEAWFEATISQNEETE
ncbi:MAG: beta-N-acetylhexosaminidase [Microbacteriaceae bacterium]|jgi:beta-N-acetylhexosaminidase|nr:beta-N-acetylhexosaminidase [Microbacteriaceae bacterium]